MHPRKPLVALLALALLAGCAPAAPAPAPPVHPPATAQSGAAPTEAQPSPALLVTEAATPTPVSLTAPTGTLPPIPTEGPPVLAAPSPTPDLPEPTISAQDGNDLALLRTVGWGHVNTALIAPDHKLIAAGTTAGVVLISLPELQHLRLYRVAGGVKNLAFSPSGGLLAVVGGATELRRVGDWSLAARLSGDTPLFSPDGQTVATQLGKPNPTMMLWRMDGQLLARLPDEQAAAFSPDGALLATRSGAKVLLRRSADGTSLRELDGLGPAFSPDGTLLALLSPDGTDAQSWSAGDIVSARQPARRLASGLNPAKSEGTLAFSADGQSLTAAISGEPTSGGPPGALRVWRLSDGSLSVQRECRFCLQHLSRYGTFTVEIQYPNGIGSVVTVIKRTADGQTLSSFESFTTNSGTFTERTLRFSADKTIGVADLELALQEEGVPFHLELPGFETIGYSPDAQTLIGAGRDLTLWDVTTGALRVWHKPLKAIWEGGPVPPTRYRLLGRVVIAEWYLLSQPLSVTAVAWDTQTGEELWQTHTPKDLAGDPLAAWAFNTDGAYALARGSQASLYPRSGGPQVVAMTSNVSALVFSPDGAALAVGDQSGQVQIVSASDAKSIGGLRLPDGAAVAGLAFSPDGKRLAAFDQQGNVALLRSLGDQAPATIKGSQGLRGVTFSPDGTVLGLQGQSGSILVWRDTPGAAPVRLQGAPTSALTFSYDNQILLVAEESGLAIYRLSDGALLRRLDGTTQLSAIGPRRRLIGLLRDGLAEEWGVRK